jgi:hypothetical protein
VERYATRNVGRRCRQASRRIWLLRQRLGSAALAPVLEVGNTKGEAGLLLKPVDVLCVHSKKATTLVQRLQETVKWCRSGGLGHLGESADHLAKEGRRRLLPEDGGVEEVLAGSQGLLGVVSFESLEETFGGAEVGDA